MIVNKLKNSFWIKNSLIIFSFIFFATFNVLIVWHGKILNGFDMSYHLERLMELVRSPEVFPQFNLHTLSNNGAATMTVYPYLWLYPFAILIKLFGSLRSVIYFMFIVSTFVTLMIAYYSSIKLGNKKVSYIFALMYTLSYEFMDLNYWQSDIAMSFSATFMPLIIFGFVYWLKSSKWLMLSIGLSCIIYSNVPMAFLTIILIFGWLIYNYKEICSNKYQFINIIKCGFLTIITTALFWMPALKLFYLNKFNGLGNPHQTADTVNLISALGATLNPLHSFSYNNNFYPLELTIYALFGLILGIIYFKHFDKYFKQLYIFGIITIVISTSFFPWSSRILSNIGGIFQTTFRIFLIPQLIFTYILAIEINNYLDRSSNKQILFCLMIIVVLLLQFSYASIFRSQQMTSTTTNKGVAISKYLTDEKMHTPLWRVGPSYYLGNNNVINNTNFDNSYINHKMIHFTPLNKGGFYLKIKKNINTLSVPFIGYDGCSYKSYIDGKFVKSYVNKNHLMTINNIKSGKHYINIVPQLTKVDVIARTLTIASIFLYIYILFKKRIFI